MADIIKGMDPITHLVVWPVLLHFEWNLWRWCLLQPRNRIITTGRYEFNKVSTGHIIEWFLGVYTCMYIHTAVFSYKI